MKPILLVEDNEDDIFFMRRAFKGGGILNPLMVVRDGQAAIDYLEGAGAYADRERCPFPGMVLLDLKLPLRTGFEVLQWIRSKPALDTLITVVLTASAETTDVQKGYQLGANSYLVKPPTPAKLMEMMKALKLYWLEFDRSGSRE
jgi:CheY-like chemotaxis protein